MYPWHLTKVSFCHKRWYRILFCVPTHDFEEVTSQASRFTPGHGHPTWTSITHPPLARTRTCGLFCYNAVVSGFGDFCSHRQEFSLDWSKCAFQLVFCARSSKKSRIVIFILSDSSPRHKWVAFNERFFGMWYDSQASICQLGPFRMSRDLRKQLKFLWIRMDASKG